MLEGSSALLEEWTEQLRARWAGHPAGASAGGSIGGAWLDGDAAQAVAVTRRWPRTSPATSTRMARGPGPGCACSWTGSAATPAPARTTPAPTKTAAFGRTAPTPATPASASSARARPARTPPRRGKPSRLSLISSGVCQALDHAAGVRSAAPAPGFSSNDGALMPLGRPRCSIVVVTAAGRTAVPGCGAGAWGSRGMRESRGGGGRGGGRRGRRSAGGVGMVLGKHGLAWNQLCDSLHRARDQRQSRRPIVGPGRAGVVPAASAARCPGAPYGTQTRMKSRPGVSCWLRIVGSDGLRLVPGTPPAPPSDPAGWLHARVATDAMDWTPRPRASACLKEVSADPPGLT